MSTLFAKLSPEAQTAIVAVIMGGSVPPLSESAKAEIKAWAETHEDPPSEAAIHADVFNPAETDLQYLQRRQRELAVKR